MNCDVAISQLAWPEQASAEAWDHLEGCEVCRAQHGESRRVAGLLAGLPGTHGRDIASRVMARIGYGNGRPTRDKIRDQLSRVRQELDEVCAGISADEASWRPGTGEPSVADVLAHLPIAERDLVKMAMKVARDHGADVEAPADAAIQATFKVNAKSGATGDGEHLRRVRARTLRFVSDVRDAELGTQGPELLRTVYRHEAEHLAQIEDILWRARRPL